ncbi:MAG: ATP-binding cassette domain-containing protein [Actinomycetota bacterium]
MSELLVADLTKRYHDAPALGPLDLAVGAGERVTLVGHNGSGKTTLLRVLTGLLDPTSGEATIGGHEPSSIEARSMVSYIADRPVFYDDLSVWEHVEYVSRLHATDDWEQHGVDLLDELGLDDRIDDLPVTFSRGLQQRAAIAIALCRPFDVLFVDEPFVGLDRRGRHALLDRLDAAHAEGATIVVATHDAEAIGRAHRLVVLRDGLLVHDGGADDIDLDAALDRHAPAGPTTVEADEPADPSDDGPDERGGDVADAHGDEPPRDDAADRAE